MSGFTRFTAGGLTMPWRSLKASLRRGCSRLLKAPAARAGDWSPGRRDVVQMAATITLSWPFSPDDIALLHKLLQDNGGDATPSAGAAPAPAPSVAAAVAPPPAPVDYFPADAGLAPFPSPENSQMLVLGKTVGGRPYLKDSLGNVHQLKVNAAGEPEYWVNGGSQMVGWGMHANAPPAQLLVRQGGVYIILTNGISQMLRGGSIYNTAVPPAWTTTAGGQPVPTLPALPTPSSIAPGSSGRVIKCGAGQAIPTLSAAIPTAKAGDKIEVARGTYTDTPPAWTVPLLIDLGGATFNAAGKTATLAREKALFCPAADSIIQNGTITNVAMDQAQGQLTSAIRPDAGCGYLTISRMTMTNNQCAVGHGGFPIVIAISDSDISDNGLKANKGALTHDLYVGIECRRLTMVDVIANGANEGHAIKYRGPELIVNGGTFASAPGKPFDIPNGCGVPFRITRATIIKGANDPDHGIIACGEEGTENGLAGGTINGGAIRADCNNPFILSPGGTITLKGVALSGNKIAATGGVVLAGL